jgi:hypothetical protein
VALQIGCVLVGLVASFIPVLPKTHSFWGCYWAAWTSATTNEVTVTSILPDSPASAAGLAKGDAVLAVDGKPIDGLTSWVQMIEQLQPGQQARLLVKHDGEESIRTVKGDEPRWEALMYYHWQLAYAGSCALLLVLLVASQPTGPQTSLWRPMVLILAGLVAAWALLVTDWQWSFVLLLWRRPVDNRPYAWLQAVVCLSMAVSVVVLGTSEIRAILALRRQPIEPVAALA